MLDVRWDFYPNIVASIDKHLVDMNPDDAIVHPLDQFFVIFEIHLSQSTANETLDLISKL